MENTETEKLAIAEKISHMALNYTIDNFKKPNPTLDRLEIAAAYFQGAKYAVKNGLTLPTERKPVSIVTENGGKVVRVETLDECFGITLHDAEGGKEVNWNEAFERYQLPTKKQASIICAYLDEINAALVDAGGDKLDKWYWTSSEYTAYRAWFYYGNHGILGYGYSKFNTNSVRPVLAF